MIRHYPLRLRREALGLSLLQLANRAGCPVETVLHAEFGFEAPAGAVLCERLAAAYDLTPDIYAELASRAVEEFSAPA